MTTKETGTLHGGARRSARAVPLLHEPPLGHLQAIILHTLDGLGREAYGYKVLEVLRIETGEWLDHAQIYSTIRRMLARDPLPFLEHVETRASPDGGPPYKIYKVTVAGRGALQVTADHHEAVARRLGGRLLVGLKVTGKEGEAGAEVVTVGTYKEPGAVKYFRKAVKGKTAKYGDQRGRVPGERPIRELQAMAALAIRPAKPRQHEDRASGLQPRQRPKRGPPSRTTEREEK